MLRRNPSLLNNSQRLFHLFFTLIFALFAIALQAQVAGTPYIGYVAKPAPLSSTMGTMGTDFWVTFQSGAYSLQQRQ